MSLVTKRRVYSRVKLLDFLRELAEIPATEACSIYLPPDLPPSEVESSLKAIHKPSDIMLAMTEFASSSKTGVVIFWSTERKCLIIPPFPIVEKHLTHDFSTANLRSLLERDYVIALVLVRLGSYAVGVCRGEKLISSKVGTGNIHGRHKKGGSSAHRFERHRDKQIEYFLTRVCQHAREHLEPHEKTLDYISYGGARTTIHLLQKQCQFLEKLNICDLPPLLDIPEPRQTVLETAISRVWSSIVIEWQED